jgi:hypothetical protein
VARASFLSWLSRAHADRGYMFSAAPSTMFTSITPSCTRTTVEHTRHTRHDTRHTLQLVQGAQIKVARR